jgi:hypothetical protein
VVIFHAEGPPVGFTVDAKLILSPATHSDSDGQEITPPESQGGPKSVRVQRGLPAVGRRDQSTPSGPTATHNDAEAHETLLNPVPLLS